MNDKKNVKRGIMAAAIAVIILITYNVSLFALAGFSNHRASFWISYVFAMLSFFVVMISGALVAGGGRKPKDWWLGYPIFSHCAVYIIVEIIVSIVFMVLDHFFKFPWGISLAVQMIILGVHLVFNISCFIARDTIREIKENSKNKTIFLEASRVEVEMLAETAIDAEIKAAYTKLAEEFLYSDPVSSPMLLDVEQRLAAAIHQAKLPVQANDKAAALKSCEQIHLILTERNKKSKIYKQ